MTRTQRAALASAAATAVFLFLIARSVGGPRVTLFVDDLGVLAATAVASLTCVWAARRGAGRAWFWLSLWTGLWGAGQLTWCVYELLLHTEAPFPSLADAGYLAAVPFALVGLFAFPAGRRRTGTRLRSLLDALVIAGCLGAVTWEAVLAPIVRDATGWLELALGLVYPVTDLTLIVVALSVAARSVGTHRRQLAILALGIAAVGAADCFWVALATTGSYTTGQLLDGAWVLGFLLVGVAAVSAVEQPKEEGRRDTTRLIAWLDAAPYLPIALVLGLAAWEQLHHGRLDAGLVVTGVPVFALTLARQIVINLDNTRLAARLRSEAASHRAAEEALAEAQSFASLGSFSLDVATGAVEWSDEHYRILGYEPGGIEASLATVLATIHPDDAARVGLIMEQAERHGKPFHAECRILRPTGEERWVTCSGHPQQDASGTVTAIRGTIQDITERHLADASILAGTARLERSQRVAHLASWEWSVETGVVAWSDEFFRIYGLEPGSIEPSTDYVMHHVHPDDRQDVDANFARIQAGGAFEETICRILRPDGEVRWILNQAEVPEVEPGASLVGTILDITELKSAEAELREAEVRFRQGFEHSPLGMLITEPEGPILSVNPAMCAITGRTRSDLVGQRPRDFIHADDLEMVRAARMRALMADGTGVEEYDAHLQRPDGTVVLCTVKSSLVRNEAGAPLYFFGQVQDITDRRLAEVALAHQARHDSLTGAANRVALQEALDAAADQDIALLILDLDEFKDINDSLGHDVGDRVLAEIATRLRQATRPRDCVARLGGDEFAVLLHGVVKEEEAARIARKLLSAVEKSLFMEGIALQVGGSIGLTVARRTRDGDLMRRADVAMYRAKKEGTGVASYQPSDDHDGASRLALVADMRTAISNGEIGLYYQPKVAVASGLVVGVEALARWNHPTRGPISPAEFIPLAEHTGLILPLTRRLLDEALAQCASWDALGLHIGMSVNLSPRLLHDPDLTTWIHVALRVHSLPGERLTLEITENALAEGPVAVDAMTALRRIGVRLSIDDLGTGFSSLMYLKRLPIDELKIDRAFITDLATDRRDQAIVRAIVDLGRSLNLTVVAEGVEDDESLAVLRRLMCPVAQGFHCRRPAPPDELTPWLQEQSQVIALN